MASLIRTTLITTAAALFAACGGGSGDAGGTATATSGAALPDNTVLFDDDYILGNADAPVTLLEYASVACPACANWHANVYPEFKEKYVETGRVRFVFRPFPTNPVQMANTGHKLAYCGKREDYFTNIKLQFDRQSQILDMLQRGKGRDAYVSLAKASGLTEEEFIACLQDEAISERYQEVIQTGEDMGVRGTPSFFVNGEKVNGFTLETLENALLPALGEAVPAAADTPDAEAAE